MPRHAGLLHILAYVLLPLCWLIVLWGHGAYDRRYLGMGTDEFKRVVRASITMIAIVSFLAFTFKKGQDLSRVSVARRAGRRPDLRAAAAVRSPGGSCTWSAAAAARATGCC